MQNKYNIGQAVENGRIFRIDHPLYFLIQTAIDRGNVSIDSLLPSFKSWNNIDEKWFEKPLYAIKFVTPVAILSKEEFVEHYPYISKEPELFEQAYCAMVEKRYTLMLPEEAIVPVEEENENETDNSGKQEV